MSTIPDQTVKEVLALYSIKWKVFNKKTPANQEKVKMFIQTNEKDIRANPKKYEDLLWYNVEMAEEEMKFNSLYDEMIAKASKVADPKLDKVDVTNLMQHIAEYNFGHFRDGFDIEMYKRLLMNHVLTHVEPDKKKLPLVLAFIQTWCVKMNLFGTRIKADNYIVIGEKKVTAQDFLDMLNLKKATIKEDFNKLTLTRILRIFVDEAAAYAKKKTNDFKPGLFSQIPQHGLPDELHFLNAIYCKGAREFKKPLINLCKDFDDLIRKQNVVLQVKSYEARAIAFFDTPSALIAVIAGLKNTAISLDSQVATLKVKAQTASEEEMMLIIERQTEITQRLNALKDRILALEPPRT